MANGTNQPQTPDLAPDGPVYEDGNIQTQQPIQQPTARMVQEDAADRNDAPQWKDDKRSENFNRARERRQQQTEEWSGDPNDPDALYGSNTDQGDLGEIEQESLRQRQQAPGQQQQQQPQRTLNGIDPTFLATRAPIIVDGQVHEITVEEAFRAYQLNLAADKRFEQSKQLLQQVSQMQPGMFTPNGQADTGAPPGQEDSSDFNAYDEDANTRRRPANARELVEKIQIGSPEEAEQALADFIDKAVQREAPIDDTTRVLTALEDVNSRDVLQKFARENPQIEHPVVQAETVREAQRNMAVDLMNAGYSVDQLRQLAPDAKSLNALHKQARIHRLPGVRSVEAIVHAGYHGAMNNIRQLSGLPAQQMLGAPAPSMQQRQQRKDALQAQPAARRLQPSLNAPSQQRSQDQTRSAAVAKMRQQRGQPT